MDPATLAAAVIAVIRPLFGKFTGAVLERAGENTADNAGALYRVVSRRLHRDAYTAAMLNGAQEKPGNPARTDALTSALSEILREDAGFAAELAGLLGSVSQTMTVTGSGAAAGRDINQTGTYIAGRDMTITDRPPRPAT